MNTTSIPGVIVREVTTAVPQIRGATKNIGGFVGRALRGPVAVPIRITSFAQYVRIFGAYDPSSYLTESVEAFFGNGGTVCYVCRVLGSSTGTNVKAALTMASAGGAASAGSLSSSAGAFPAALFPGATFLCLEDAGVAQTATIVANQASITGVAGTFAAPTAAHTLVLALAGVANQTVTFAGTENTNLLYAAAINAQIRGGTATISGGQVKITADRAGSSSSGSVVSGSADVLASLGLAVGAFTLTGGSNVANVDAVLATELATIFNAAFITPGSTWVGNNTTGTLAGKSNTTGATSKIQFTSGTGVSLVAGFNLTAYTGSASAPTNLFTLTAVGEGYDANNISVVVTPQNSVLGLSLTVAAAAGSIASVTLASYAINRLTVGDTVSLFDSGTSATLRGVVASIQGNVVTFQNAPTLTGALNVATTTVTMEAFALTVLYGGSTITGPITGLRQSPLSTQNYFATVLGGVLSGSLGANALNPEYLVTVTDLGVTSTANVDLRPVNVISSGDYLSGGSNCTTFADLDYIGQNATLPYTGVYAMKAMRDLRILALPGLSGTNGFISQTLIQLCDSWKFLFGIVASQLNASTTAIATYRQSLGSTSYAAFYAIWYKIISKLTGQLAMSPPEGYIMGMYCRTDNAQGIQKAPAGDVTGQILGVQDVERNLSDDDYALLYPLNVNASFNVPGAGICVEGSRTMENSVYTQISVRRTMIYLEQSLKTGSRFVIFEPNTPATRAKLKRATDNFLEGEWKRGTLSGTTRNAAYFTKCDTDNNPQNLVAAGQMLEDIQVSIPLVVENLIINVSQNQAIAVAVGS
jgi:phage tail sheath protein FI